MKTDMTDINQIAITSPDGRQERLEQLRGLFPDLFDGEGQLDEKALRQLISDEVGVVAERFSFEWAGKHKSKRFAFTPSKATLQFDAKRSVNKNGSPNKSGEPLKDNTSKNLIIEGDNLEVLKLLQATYFEQVKCIYIDPPYNTGNDFIYSDDYSQTRKDYWEKNGTVKEGIRLNAVSESCGRRHSNWLNMIQSRLLLSRQLLTQNGVIFISIDDHEQSNLKAACDDIFGASNFVACLPTVMNLKGNHDNFGFSDTHEYTIVYAKDKSKCSLGMFDLPEEEVDEWKEDEYGLYKRADTLRRTGQDASREKRGKGWFPVFISHDGQVYVTDDDKSRSEDDVTLFPENKEGDELSWSWGKKKITAEPHNLIVIDGKNGKNIYKKQRPQLGELPTSKPKSIFYKPEYSTSTATTKLKELLGAKIFDGPKPVPYLKDLLRIGTEKNSVFMDFFAGSGTSAQATLEVNAEDGGNRRFISVQIPELTSDKSEARKAGFKVISEITIERIKRAGIKIREDNPKSSIDTGFRVFKLSDSNFPQNLFSPDPAKSEEANLKALEAHLAKATQMRLFDEDEFSNLVTEISLKNGFGLFYELKPVDGLSKNKVYRLIGNDKSALLCLDNDLHDETVEGLKPFKDKQLIVSKFALDTTKKFSLQTEFKDNLWVV